MRLTPPPLPPAHAAASPAAAASANPALTVVLYVVWICITLAADGLAFLMFAFADSPGAASAVQAMIVPVFAWFAFTFIAGAVLLLRKRIWRIALAFVLAVSPPFVVFAGYNLLSAGGSGGRSSSVPVNAPPTSVPTVRTPPGGFAPKFTPPEQPDFRRYVSQRALTQPTSAPSK